ncbi:MAG: hypothetical protein LBD74_01005 [Spirochaetaceae bacterium]|jgi:hypothetical protein|nr:hypothetical protein [Spirochaetaceae bacterium]
MRKDIAGEKKKAGALPEGTLIFVNNVIQGAVKQSREGLVRGIALSLYSSQ